MEREVNELLLQAREIIRQELLAFRRDPDNRDYTSYLETQMLCIDKCRYEFEENQNE